MALYLFLSCLLCIHFSCNSTPLKLNTKWITQNIGVIAIASSVNLYAPPSFAAQTASQLFSDAEKSIVLTQKEYKQVDANWAASKRFIAESSQNFGKIREVIKSIEHDVESLQASIDKQNKESENSIALLESEVERLKASVAVKFDLAKVEEEKDSTKLSTVQKLYKDAENEVNLLDHESSLLAKYRSVWGTNPYILPAKVQDIQKDLTATLKSYDDFQIQQGTGLALMTEGLTKNENACHYGGPVCASKDQNGVALFRKGINEASAAENGFVKIGRDVVNDLKYVCYHA